MWFEHVAKQKCRVIIQQQLGFKLSTSDPPQQTSDNPFIVQFYMSQSTKSSQAFLSKGGRAVKKRCTATWNTDLHLNLKQKITSSKRAGTKMAQQWLNRPGLCERSYKSKHQLQKSITVMEKKDWKVPALVRQTGNCHPPTPRACCRALSSREAWRGHSIAEADDWQ